jgi:hypothetical protein
MADYKIYLLNNAGRIVSGSAAEFQNDEEALGTAVSNLSEGAQAEVWSGKRCVGLVTAGLVRQRKTAPAWTGAAGRPGGENLPRRVSPSALTDDHCERNRLRQWAVRPQSKPVGTGKPRGRLIGNTDAIFHFFDCDPTMLRLLNNGRIGREQHCVIGLTELDPTPSTIIGHRDGAVRGPILAVWVAEDWQAGFAIARLAQAVHGHRRQHKPGRRYRRELRRTDITSGARDGSLANRCIRHLRRQGNRRTQQQRRPPASGHEGLRDIVAVRGVGLGCMGG